MKFSLSISPNYHRPTGEMRPDYSFLYLQEFILMSVGNTAIQFDNAFKNRMYQIYSIFVGYAYFTLTQQLLVSAIALSGCVPRLVELLSYYLCVNVSYIINRLSRSSNMDEFLKYVMKYEDTALENEEEKSIYKKYALIHKKIVIFLMIALLGVTTFWYAMKTTMSVESTDTCPIFKNRGYQMYWYPRFIFDGLPRLVQFLDLFLLTLVCIFMTYVETLLIFCVLFLLSQVKILHQMIRSCKERSLADWEAGVSFGEALGRVILTCVKKQQEIERLLNLFNEACSEILLLIFFVNSFNLGLFLIQFISVQSVIAGMISFFVGAFNLAHVAIFLWYSNELFVESTETLNVIYFETDWIDFNTRNRKLLLLMMTRSQRPLSCHSKLLGDINIETFKKMMKICYTVATYYRTVN